MTTLTSDDFSNDIFTAGNLTIGGAIKGEIETPGDTDWVRIYIASGTTVKFALLGTLGAAGTLGGNPLESGSLRLYDEDGSFLLATENSGANGAPELVFTAINSGYFYIEVAENFGSGTGAYTLSVSESLETTDQPLSITQYDPLPDSSSVDILSDLSFTFNADILRGSGTISLKLQTGEILESYDAGASPALSFDKNNLIINPISNLDYGTKYVLEFSANAILDSNGRQYIGTSQFSFTTKSKIPMPTINGTDGIDTLVGTSSDEILLGGGGNDTLIGSGGKDIIDGGPGFDVAVFDYKLASFSLRQTGSTYALTGKDGLASVSATFNAVESLKFSDMKVNLTIQSLVAESSTASVQRLMELYIAFFNRVPDSEGLAYWIGEMNAGRNINQVANSFYDAGVAFSNLTGFSADMTNPAFINLVYRNVLGRSEGADATGLAYWSGELAAGRATRGTLVSTILDSAHTFKGDFTWGFVADLLDNKITVAKVFAVDLGLTFVSDSVSITQGNLIAKAVTSTDTSAALALIGISPVDINL